MGEAVSSILEPSGEGNAPEGADGGNGPEGDNPEGAQPEGNEPEGGAPAGDGAEGGEPEGDKDEPQGAPEQYEQFNLPEGVQEDAIKLDAFTEWAKSNNLSQEAAQSAVDIYFDIAKEVSERSVAALEEQATAWFNEVKADANLGGEHFEDTKKHVALVSKNIQEFDKVYELLGQWGVQNHPEVVRAFNALGKLFAEDRFVSGNGNATVQKTAAQTLYPSMS